LAAPEGKLIGIRNKCSDPGGKASPALEGMNPSAGEPGPRGAGVRSRKQERGISPVASLSGPALPELLVTQSAGP